MDNKKTLDVKKLVHTSIFFSLCIILVIFQIPVYGFLNLDFSIVPLLLCAKMVGYKEAFIISFLFPWFAMFSYLPADIVGVLILITVNVTLLSFNYLFSKMNMNEWVSMTLSTLATTFTITLLNIFIFTPWYYEFNYEYVMDAFWYYFWMYLGFNFGKIGVNYICCYFVNTSIKKIYEG